MTVSSKTAASIAKTETVAREVTKDTGRVHIGGGLMHFGETTTARDTTKDAGRVHVGGGLMRF